MDITSFVLGYKKGKAEGGGALTEPVCHVTFMNGGTVLYEKPVFVGDDCTDIVKKGTIGTPSKASTPQYNYTYTGWSLTNGGEASTSALAAVSGDRTVYAAYTSAVRYYTITYLDSDGYVLKTETLAYGAMPSYAPEKEGYFFDGWSPELVTVTGDATYTAQFTEALTFAKGSWADIANVSEAGEAANYFNVGDSKLIPVSIDGTEYQFIARIVGINVDKTWENNTVGISCLMFTSLSETRVWKSGTSPYVESGSAVNQSEFYTEHVKGFFDKLPVDLQNVIKKVRKKWNYAGSTTKTDNAAYCWIPSFKEVTTTSAGTTCTVENGELYPYFNESRYYGYRNAETDGTYPYAIYDENGNRATLQNCSIWLRDMCTRSNNPMCMQDGVPKMANAYMACRVVIGFCI